MSSTIAAITFDCAHATSLAWFWADVLGRTVDPEEQGAGEYFASIGRTAPDGGPVMMFIKVPEGKSAKNRVHLDLATADRAAEIERVVALGATHVHDRDEWGVSWSTLRDPEGNEFCIAEE
jgi:predicted enzyme related to lactoylglutathione lyase